MNLYEAARVRYSSRKYLMEELEDKLYSEITNHIHAMFPLVDDVDYNIDIVNMIKDKRYINYVPIKAPYYICFSCKTDDRSFINAGYMLEMISAYLTQKGLGSCFVALYSSKLVQKDGMKLTILLAFGKTKELPYREEKYAKRLPVDRITTGYAQAGDKVKNIIDLAILAPTAFNSQPFRFAIKDESIEICLKKHKPYKVWKRLDMISLGATIANMMIAAEDKWQEAHIEMKESNQVYFSDSKYICSLELTKGNHKL